MFSPGSSGSSPCILTHFLYARYAWKNISQKYFFTHGLTWHQARKYQDFSLVELTHNLTYQFLYVLIDHWDVLGELMSWNVMYILTQSFCYLFQSTIISNVLSLCHSAINIKSYSRKFVLWILVYNTLCLLSKFADRCIVPPLLKITLLVKLSSLVIKTMRYFMPYDRVAMKILRPFFLKNYLKNLLESISSLTKVL